MRIKKGSIRARVKSDLLIAFTDEKLSAHGGLELFRRFVEGSGFADRLRDVFSIRQFDGDYGSFRITLALIGMLLLGGTRLRHLGVLERDPLFLRFARLHKLPTDRTVSNTLKETTGAVREHYEYSAVATNKRAGLRTLWDFMAGRGGHEKTLCELKQHVAFDTIPTRDWDANSTWQLISALTHNLVRQFQLATTAKERPNGRKRTYRWVFESLRTLRYEVLNLPAKLARPQGRSELRIAAAPETQERITEILEALPEAA